MRLFSLYLQFPVTGIPERDQFSFTLLLFQHSQDFFFCIQGDDDHSAAQASQADPLLLFSPQEFKDGHRADLRGHFLLRAYNGKLLFLNIITQDQQPHSPAHTRIFRLRDPSDTFHLAPAPGQELLHGILMRQADFFPVNAPCFL